MGKHYKHLGAEERGSDDEEISIQAGKSVLRLG